MPQEQLANQQQLQLQQQHSQNHQEATPWKELENAHLYTDDTSTLVDVFVPRDDVLDTEDNETDVTDRELERFKCFCFMNKLQENYPKATVRVNLCIWA